MRMTYRKRDETTNAETEKDTIKTDTQKERDKRQTIREVISGLSPFLSIDVRINL